MVMNNVQKNWSEHKYRCGRDTRRSVLSGLCSQRLALLPYNEIIKQSWPRLYSHTDVINQSINLEVEDTHAIRFIIVEVRADCPGEL